MDNVCISEIHGDFISLAKATKKGRKIGLASGLLCGIELEMLLKPADKLFYMLLEKHTYCIKPLKPL